MLTRGEKIYNWRYGAMTIFEVQENYVFANIDDPGQVVLAHDPFDPYLTQKCKWPVKNGNLIEADKCFQISGLGYYFHESELAAIVSNQEVTAGMQQKMQPEFFPIDASLLHKGLYSAYIRVMRSMNTVTKAAITQWEKCFYGVFGQKYPDELGQDEIQEAIKDSKNRFPGPDDYNRYCNDMDKLVVVLKPLPVRALAKLSKVNDSSYMINFQKGLQKELYEANKIAITHWERDYYDVCGQKYPDEMEQDDIQNTKRISKNRFPDPDDYKRYCDDMDKLVKQLTIFVSIRSLAKNDYKCFCDDMDKLPKQRFSVFAPAK